MKPTKLTQSHHTSPSPLTQSSKQHPFIHSSDNPRTIQKSTYIQNKQSFICFNPDCSLSRHRIFVQNNIHRNREQCKKWLINVKELGYLLDVYGCGSDISLSDRRRWVMQRQQQRQQIVDNGNIQVNVDSTQISTIIKSFKRLYSIKWQQYLISYKQKLLKQYQTYLSNIFQHTYNLIQNTKYSEIISDLGLLYIKINQQDKQKYKDKDRKQYQLHNLLEKIIQQAILDNINKKIQVRYRDIEQIKMDQGQFKYMESYIQNIANNIIQIKQPTLTTNNPATQTTTVSQLQKSNNNSHNLFHKFMLEQPSNFNKLQQVAAMAGKKCQQFNLKSRDISLKCPFCSYQIRKKLLATQFQLQGKMIKKQLATEILVHAYNDHYNFLFERYQRKFINKKTSPISTILQPSCHQITFSQMISNLITKDYKKLHIFDRQSGITKTYIPPKLKIILQQNKTIDDTYYIQILSRSNKQMARMKYILTPDRKTTQFIINYLLVYVCLVTNIIKIQDIIIQSNCKDINRLVSIREVLKQKYTDMDNGNIIQNEDNNQYILKRQISIAKNSGNDKYTSIKQQYLTKQQYLYNNRSKHIFNQQQYQYNPNNNNFRQEQFIGSTKQLRYMPIQNQLQDQSINIIPNQCNNSILNNKKKSCYQYISQIQISKNQLQSIDNNESENLDQMQNQIQSLISKNKSKSKNQSLSLSQEQSQEQEQNYQNLHKDHSLSLESHHNTFDIQYNTFDIQYNTPQLQQNLIAKYQNTKKIINSGNQKNNIDDSQLIPLQQFVKLQHNIQQKQTGKKDFKKYSQKS